MVQCMPSHLNLHRTFLLCCMPRSLCCKLHCSPSLNLHSKHAHCVAFALYNLPQKMLQKYSLQLASSRRLACIRLPSADTSVTSHSSLLSPVVCHRLYFFLLTCKQQQVAGLAGKQLARRQYVEHLLLQAAESVPCLFPEGCVTATDCSSFIQVQLDWQHKCWRIQWQRRLYGCRFCGLSC